MNNRVGKQKPGLFKYILILALKAAFIVTIGSLLNPTISRADGPFKPKGTAETNISVWIPEGSVDLPVLITADYIAERDLPAGISYPPGTVGQAFTFGLWRGESTTLRRFDPSIVITTKYEDGDIPPTIRPEEEHLHLQIYDPSTQAWIKLCSSVDIHGNNLSAALSTTIPFEEEGSSLLAIAVDSTPPLEQVVDDQGLTTISIKGSDLRLQVLPDEVAVGTHFAISVLPNVSNIGSFKLFSKPVDIKACWTNQPNPHENNRQITRFFKPLKVEFDYDPDTLSRAGGQANLTIVNRQDRQWIDVEEVGARVERDNNTITVDTRSLGIFGLAAR